MDSANKSKEKRRKEKRPPIVSGVIWLGIGLFMLAGQRNLIGDIETDQLWPLIIILVGVAVIVGAMRRNRSAKESS